MIGAHGCEPLVTHLFVAGDQYLDSDVVFGVKESLICEFAHMPAGAAAAGRIMERPYYFAGLRFHAQAPRARKRRRRVQAIAVSAG